MSFSDTVRLFNVASFQWPFSNYVDLCYSSISTGDSHICISVPVNLRHLDCTIAWCSPHALTTTKALLSHHRPRNCSTLYFITARCLQIVVKATHCASKGYMPVGDSAILADVICPAWPGTLPLFPRVKRKMRTVLAKQGLASLHPSMR